MEYQFNETTIPEDLSKQLAKRNCGVSPEHVDKIMTTAVAGTSVALGDLMRKDPTIPKAVIFRSIVGTFIVGAKLSYVPNEDENDLSNGRWDYTWSFYEDDFEDIKCYKINELSVYYRDKGIDLYNMRIQPDSLEFIVTNLFEIVKQWLAENAAQNPVLVLKDVFTANSIVNDDGEIEFGFVPDGAMKILVKNDASIQEAD